MTDLLNPASPTGMAITSASNAAAMAEDRAERRAACQRILDDYAPEAASVADMRAYARCVDLIHGAADDPIRGWSTIIFVLVTFAGIYAGSRIPASTLEQRALHCLLGAGVGMILGTLLGLLLKGVTAVL
jgi:hypothetical protein